MVKNELENLLEDIYKFRLRNNRNPKLVKISRDYYFRILCDSRNSVVWNLTKNTKTVAGILLEIDPDPNAEKYVFE